MAFDHLLQVVLSLLVTQSLAVNIPTWPPVDEVCSLAEMLDGELLLPGNPKYDEYRQTKNTYYTNTPGMIILAKSEGNILYIQYTNQNIFCQFW